MLTCPNCSNAIDSKTQFCPYCDVPVKDNVRVAKRGGNTVTAALAPVQEIPRESDGTNIANLATQMNSKLQPAIVGGVAVGLLSLLPVVSWLFFLWAIGGGALAVYLYVRRSPTPVQIIEGIMLGGVTGVVGGFVYFIIEVPLGYLIATSDPQQVWLRGGKQQILLGIFIVGVFMFIVLLVLTMIGGLLAVPLFEQRRGGPMVPPTPPSSGTALSI